MSRKKGVKRDKVGRWKDRNVKTFHSSFVTPLLHTCTTAALECGHLPSAAIKLLFQKLSTIPCPTPLPDVPYYPLPSPDVLYNPLSSSAIPRRPALPTQKHPYLTLLGLLTSPKTAVRLGLLRVPGLLGTLKEGQAGSLGTLKFRGSDAVIPLWYTDGDRPHVVFSSTLHSFLCTSNIINYNLPTLWFPKTVRTPILSTARSLDGVTSS